MKTYRIPLHAGNVYSIMIVRYDEFREHETAVFVNYRDGGYKTYWTACKCVARLACCGPYSVNSEKAMKIVRGGLTAGQKAALTRMMKG